MEILFFIASLIYTVRGLFSNNIEKITYRVFDEKTYKICLGFQNAGNCVFCILIALFVLIQTATDRDLGKGTELLFCTQFACNALYTMIVCYIASPKKKEAILKLFNSYKADHTDLDGEELLLAFCREYNDLSMKDVRSAIRPTKNSKQIST